jgi:CheY-like chemotaxis protein
LDIYLPVTRDLPGEKTQRVVLQDYTGNEKILVIDDVPEQCEIAEKMLSKLGYQVTSVTSGESAVSYLKIHTVDLVVLDMVMPQGMDGLETYKHIIKIHPGQKAIITSGYSESEQVREVQRLGVGEYIQKPYTLEKIGITIRMELDRSGIKLGNKE